MAGPGEGGHLPSCIDLGRRQVHEPCLSGKKEQESSLVLQVLHGGQW